jgi:CheY-like chemotaxis protein
MAYRILLVDDEADLLDMLGDFLMENGYSVETARDGVEAMERLDREKFDLLLSDINMPRMRGFELLRRAKEKCPGMKSALITAYNVNDYIRMARDEDVGNIISKTSPFNFDEVGMMVRNLVTEDVFGLAKYMDKDADIHEHEIRHSRDIDRVLDAAGRFFGRDMAGTRLCMVMREVVTNAVFYGARNERGDQKETWEIDVALKSDEYVKVLFGRDSDKWATSVVDRKGRLKKKDVLFWLDRNIVRDLDGTPFNLQDVHGRGLFISRETIDRFIINIKPAVQTEVIAIQFMEGKFKGYRPLLINEL